MGRGRDPFWAHAEKVNGCLKFKCIYCKQDFAGDALKHTWPEFQVMTLWHVMLCLWMFKTKHKQLKKEKEKKGSSSNSRDQQKNLKVHQPRLQNLKLR